MKLLVCVVICAVALGVVSAGYIRSGWSSPSYSYYSSPAVYARPYSYGGGWNNGWNGGYSGWNNGWKGGYNGWNSGWKGW